MTVPAITRFGSSRFDLLSRRSPLCTVFMSCSVTTRFGHRYWFHVPRKLNSASAPIVGRTSGTATWRMNPQWPTPSIAAASTEVAGQRHEHLAEQEDAERGGEERHRQAR